MIIAENQPRKHAEYMRNGLGYPFAFRPFTALDQEEKGLLCRVGMLSWPFVVRSDMMMSRVSHESMAPGA